MLLRCTARTRYIGSLTGNAASLTEAAHCVRVHIPRALSFKIPDSGKYLTFIRRAAYCDTSFNAPDLSLSLFPSFFLFLSLFLYLPSLIRLRTARKKSSELKGIGGGIDSPRFELRSLFLHRLSPCIYFISQREAIAATKRAREGDTNLLLEFT